MHLDEAFSELDIDINDALNVAAGMPNDVREKVFTQDKVGIAFGANGFSVSVSGDRKSTRLNSSHRT